MNVRLKNFLKFGAGLVVIWIMVFHVCPAIIEAIPAYRAYGAQVERLELNTSDLFYNDVEAAGEAELHIRNTLRFMPRDQETE